MSSEVTMDITPVTKKSKTPKVPTFAPTTIIDNAGHGFGLHIPHEPLRQFLMGCIVPYGVISWENVYDPDDSKAKKETKDRQALFGIDIFLTSHTEQRLEQYPVDTCRGVPTNVKGAYKQFCSVLTAAKQQFEAEALQAITNDQLKYAHIGYILKEGTFAIVDNSDALVAGTVIKLASHSGWGGTYLEIGMAVSGWTGTTFAQGTHTAYIPYYQDTKSFEELGFRTVTPELVTELAARGRRYVDLNTKPNYIKL
jgi:hypothetical protein